jgi:hypothetical protein
MTSWASSREAALKPETGRISGSALSAVTLVVLPIGGTAVPYLFAMLRKGNDGKSVHGVFEEHEIA